MSLPFALVTGTSRGIGLAVAEELIRRGWDVFGLARGAAPASLGAGGPGRYAHHLLDLTQLAALEAWVADALPQRLREASRVALVNNAALLAPVGPAHRLDLGALDRHLRVNLTAPVWLAGRCASEVPATTPLRVINLSSGSATKAYPGWTGYCASKAGLHMAGEVLAEETSGYGLERDLAVVSYAPHIVATQMQAELRATREEDFPLRQRFVDLDADGALVSADGPAHEIADLCAADDLPAFSTARYQPA